MFSSSSLYLIYLFMYHRSFAKAIGCDINSLKLCAKTKTVQEILVAQLNVSSPPTLLPFGPLVDGYFLPGTFASNRDIVLYHSLQGEC